MKRVLLIPAAGRGSRLQSDSPKVLVPVRGQTMLDRLLDLYARYTGDVVVVVSPEAERDVRRHTESRAGVRIAVQERPTGMLDALLAADTIVRESNPQRIWITWCDQVGIHPDTLKRLSAEEAEQPDAAVILPTVHRPDPYIHFDRDRSGRIVAVRHRREGDSMPALGESDSGLFALSMDAFDALSRFAEVTPLGSGTAERNFLPFIPWIARTSAVITFDCADPREAIGINTPDELRQVEAYLAERGDG